MQVQCKGEEKQTGSFLPLWSCAVTETEHYCLTADMKQEMKPTAVHILWEQGMHSSHTDISKYSIFNFGHIGLILEADNNLFILI